MRALSILLGLGLALGGCAGKPLHFASQQSNSDLPTQWQQQITELESQNSQHSLLSLLSDLPVVPLIETALANNPGIQQSALQVKQSAATVSISRAAQLPQVNLSSTGVGQKNQTSTYNLKLVTQWEWDVWGRLSDGVSAQALNHKAQLGDYEYAKRTLAANMTKSWLKWQADQRKLAVAQERLTVQEANQHIIQQRYQRGLGSLKDLDSARANARQTLADTHSLQASLSQSERQLQQLSGDFLPLSLTRGVQSWPEIGFPQVSVPAQSLGLRPDLQAAFLRVQAADRQSDVAYKSMLPGLNLTFDTSLNSRGSGDLLNADPVWQLLGQLTQPVFQGGRLQAQLQQRQLQAEQSALAYREKLLAAVIQVENLLQQERSLAKQQQALEQALQFAESGQNHTQQRYRQGLSDILTLLQAQQTTFNIQTRLIDTQLSRASNRIDLGLALGLPLDQQEHSHEVL